MPRHARVKRRPEVQPPDGGLADLHPVLARIYAARGIESPADLDRSLARLTPYHALGGMEGAVRLLAEALARDRRILVVADFDADGATACAVAVRGLRLMGAVNVDFLVPNRFEFGYGLTPEIVAVAARSRPDLLVTVDNGISSLAGVEAAKQAGIQVLITDHHLPGERLPDADGLVNPNLVADAFPSKHLAGVGVIFYVLTALRAHLREAGWFAARDGGEPNLGQLLDLVALGTVADVVTLDQNNRILVAQGLARIRRGRCQPGILGLLAVAGRDHRHAAASDLAFALGPRLNAAGRLSDMSLGIECLLTDDPDAATAMAERLHELNAERREIEAEMQDQALVKLAESRLGELGALPFGVCLFDPQWHEGVIGLLASRIKERIHRPVVVFARHGAGGIKGSARSVPGLHIRDALDAVASRHPDLVDKFGGHAMAAGLSMAEGDFPAFRRAFDDEVRRRIDESELEGTLLTDGALTAGELNLEFAELLRQAGPWGQGFPEPMFDGRFEVVSRRVVGRRHLKLMLRVPGSNRVIDAIAFNQVDESGTQPVDHLFAAYRLDVNRYRGVKSPQLIVEHLEPAT